MKIYENLKKSIKINKNQRKSMKINLNQQKSMKIYTNLVKSINPIIKHRKQESAAEAKPVNIFWLHLVRRDAVCHSIPARRRLVNTVSRCLSRCGCVMSTTWPEAKASSLTLHFKCMVIYSNVQQNYIKNTLSYIKIY